MALSSDELEKKYSQIGLARRTETDREPKVTTLAFVKETWNRNSWRIQQGRNYRKKPQIFDQIAGTRPPTYDDFLVGGRVRGFSLGVRGWRYCWSEVLS